MSSKRNQRARLRKGDTTSRVPNGPRPAHGPQAAKPAPRCSWPVCTCYAPQGPHQCTREARHG